MAAALRQSALRRNGEDPYTLIYLAQLERRAAIPLLEELRVPRLQYLKWTLSDEMELLDKLARDLTAGRPIDAFDYPPEQITINRTSWVRSR